MALQLITGMAGSGKSTLAFDMVTGVAAENRDRGVFVLVPDQFSQEAGRILIDKNSGGILNIDVLSFRRLAYRALEEYRGLTRTVLTDEGKIMLLRRVFAEQKNQLQYFTKGLDRPGFLDECKSLLSELIEYGVGDDELEEMTRLFGEDSRSSAKLRDLRLLSEKIEERMGETYRMAEELIPLLTELVPEVSFLEDATVCLDDFTGFTPVQFELIGALMKRCRDVIVTVTLSMDSDDSRSEVFGLGNVTVKKLTEQAGRLGVPVNDVIVTGDCSDGGYRSYRLKDNPMLSFLERHIFSYDGEVFLPEESSEAPAVRLRVCNRERDEAAFIACETVRLIRNGTAPEKIAVVTGDMARYEPHLRRAFDAMGVEYFLDQKKSLGRNPLAEYVLAFLEMELRGFDVSSVMRFLRSGLSPVESSEADVFENYLMATGRRGFRAFLQTWTYDVAEHRMPLEQVNRTRECFAQSVEEAVEEFRGGRKTVREYATILCGLMLKNGIPEILREKSNAREEQGESLLAVEYSRLWQSMMSIITMMVDLLGEETMTLREFYEVLRAGMTEGVMGFVPPSTHQVQIGDVERSRLRDVEVIFFPGNTDLIFPKKNGSVGILSDRERERIREAGIELAPSAGELANREMFYLYRLISKPTKRLYLTWNKSDEGGEEVRPSYLIDRVREVLGESVSLENDEADPSVLPLFSVGGKIGRLPLNKHEAEISEETASALYGDTISASVTRFERYVRCPYSHFLSYGLGLEERQRYEVQSNDRGSVFHDSLEAVTKRMKEEGTDWKTVPDEQLMTFGEEAFDRVVSGYRDDLFHQDKRKEYAMKRMKRIYLDALSAIRKQMEVGDFIQAGSEVSFPDSMPSPVFDLSGGHRIRLRGRIDRYDIREDGDLRYIKLVDYKSSGKEMTLGGIYHGLEMQLVTYMGVLISGLDPAKKNVPAALFYQKIDEAAEEKDVFPDEEKQEELRLRSLRPSGFVNADEQVIYALDEKLSEGGGVNSIAAPLRTKKDGSYYDNSLAHMLEENAFEGLMERAKENIIRCGEEIYAGRIEAGPHAWDDPSKKGDGCEYCPYAGVCGVEARTKETMVNIREWLSDKEALDRLASQ